VTPAFVSRLSPVIFSLVVGVSLSTSAETVKVMNKRRFSQFSGERCHNQEYASGLEQRADDVCTAVVT